MGFDVYLVSAVIAAVVAWLVSPRFQSYDPPSDIARGFWSAVAGALCPPSSWWVPFRSSRSAISPAASARPPRRSGRPRFVGRAAGRRRTFLTAARAGNPTSLNEIGDY